MILIIIGAVGSVASIVSVAFYFIDRNKEHSLSKRPVIVFDSKYHPEHDYTTDFTVKNIGGEPAIQINMFLYEEFPNGTFEITPTPLDMSIEYLAPGKKRSIKGQSVMFVGCIGLQQMWLEYSDEQGNHYRYVKEPQSSGAVEVRPPTKIKKRIPPTTLHKITGKTPSKYV